ALDAAERRVELAGAPLLASEVCVAELCAAGASSYSIDFPCVIGIVCAAFSSPARVISAGEVAVTMPVSAVPSRIRTVACCPEAVLFAHEARNNHAPRVALTRMVRHKRFGVHVFSLEALNAV